MGRLLDRINARLTTARREDLKGLHEFCVGIVPDGFVALELWLERYDKNPNLFYMVEAFDEPDSTGAGRLIGSFILTPITEEARAMLEREELKGVSFTTEHIAAPGSEPAAMYISGIVASGRTPRAVTLHFLKEVMRREVEKGVCLFYTKPMRGDGLRVTEKEGFSPVNPAARHELDRIYKKEMC